MSTNFIHHPSSYRDPSGFIFIRNGELYRQVNNVFRDNFEFFTSSGLYEKLVTNRLILQHDTIHENMTGDANWYTTIKPEKVSFISYPYEWPFEMLRDAALLTLRLLKESLTAGMILKDATPYNIQWHQGRLVFIDSLSFEKYDETQPWIAYRQFCECFLSPLLLTHYSKIPLPEMLLAYSEGIPLQVTGSLLPWRSRFSIHVYLHIHLHAKYTSKDPAQTKTTASFSKQKLLNLIKSLEILITKLKLPDNQTTWSGYYAEAAGRADYLENKQSIIRQWLNQLKTVITVADMGANTGEFSKLAAANHKEVIATDFDPFCINTLYKDLKKSGEKRILPLVLDLSRPSPAIGVNNRERSSFIERTKVDLLLALALVHHLAIGKNIPFEKIAQLFHSMCKFLIIEFVPKEDEKVELMLGQKKDIYPGYNEKEFVNMFGQYFTILEKAAIPGAGRTLFLMEKK